MSKETQGVLQLLAASFLFSLFGIFTRLIAGEIGVFFQLFMRVSIMSGVFYLISRTTRGANKIKKNDLGLLFFRGLLIIVDFSCFYYAVTHLSLGITMFLFYAFNVITSFVFGATFLKEKMNSIKYMSLFLSLMGLMVMYVDPRSTISPTALLAISISGVCFGLTATTSKKLTNKYNSIQVNLTAYLTAALLAFPILIISKEPITLKISFITWTELVGFSLVGVGAFYLTLAGFKHVEAQKGSIILLAELLFVNIFGLLFYSETPTTNIIMGGFFILLSVIIPNINLTKLSGRR
jgi:S-adenosylmethionine uptake transporter